jgi:hypothetical protein
VLVHTFSFLLLGSFLLTQFFFLTLLVSSSFHFYLCPFLVIFLSAPLRDSFFFFRLLFSQFVFFQSFFRYFLRSIFPIYALILNIDPHLIFLTFLFSSLPVAFLKKEAELSRIRSSWLQFASLTVLCSHL